MVSGEDALRQKHRLPPALRKQVGNDAKLRAHCPVYGTTFGGQAEPLPRANRLNYVRRKAREREAKAKAKANATRSEGGDKGQARGSVRKRAQGRKNSSSSGGTLPPAFAGAATTQTTAPPPALTDPTTPSEKRMPTAPVPQAAYYHEWSICDPPTPVTPVDQHPPTSPAYTVPGPAYYQPQAPTGAYERHTVDAYHTSLHVGSQPPHATTVGRSSSPDATYAVDNAYIAYSPAARPDPQTNNGSPSMCSSPSPLAVQAESRGVTVTPPSVHSASQLDPGLLTAQDGVGHCNPVYYGFAVHSSSDSHHLTSQALSEHYADTPHPAHDGPVPQAHPTEFAAIDNAVGGSSNHGMTEQGPGDVAPVSSYATQPAGDQSVIWPAGVEHVDREGSYEMESGANDRHDAQIQYPPLAPPATWTYEGDMHPSLPTPLSSYSELAQALQYPPRAFVDDCAPSSANGSATASRTTASVEPDTPLYIHTSNGGVGVHSPGPVFLAPPCPQDVAISEEECARIIQECFALSDHLLSDISSLLLNMDFATGQASDASQQLLTTSTWQEARL